jgi:hypothetical protein
MRKHIMSTQTCIEEMKKREAGNIIAPKRIACTFHKTTRNFMKIHLLRPMAGL